jgi:hypothetical protein
VAVSVHPGLWSEANRGEGYPARPLPRDGDHEIIICRLLRYRARIYVFCFARATTRRRCRHALPIAREPRDTSRVPRSGATLYTWNPVAISPLAPERWNRVGAFRDLGTPRPHDFSTSPQRLAAPQEALRVTEHGNRAPATNPTTKESDSGEPRSMKIQSWFSWPWALRLRLLRRKVESGGTVFGLLYGIRGSSRPEGAGSPHVAIHAATRYLFVWRWALAKYLGTRCASVQFSSAPRAEKATRCLAKSCIRY